MSEGFPIGDIIILGAIAVFIILRYRSMLGDKTGRDPTDIPRKPQHSEEVERIIQLPQKAEMVKPVIPTVTFDGFTGEVRDTLRSMHKIDMDFTADSFLEGAKSAFEMILHAYSTRDHDTLKLLLAKPLYEQFATALKDEEAKGEMHENTLVAITKAEITQATLTGTKAAITVAFTSDQVQLTKNKEGVVIDGNISEEIENEDVWRFTRDLKSNDPNWTVVDT